MTRPLSRSSCVALTALAISVICLGIAGCGTPSAPAEQNAAPVTTRSDTSAIPRAEASPPRGTPVRQVRGQTLYVPCYSHIYFQDEERTINLATTLSIRNASPTDSITVTHVSYYDSAGELVRIYLDTPRTLGPLVSTYFVVREEDLHGGVGANFIVTWTTDEPVHAPVVEAVHITTRMQLGISFTSPARILNEEV